MRIKWHFATPFYNDNFTITRTTYNTARFALSCSDASLQKKKSGRECSKMLGSWGPFTNHTLDSLGCLGIPRSLQVLNEKNVQIMCDSPYLDL